MRFALSISLCDETRQLLPASQRLFLHFAIPDRVSCEGFLHFPALTECITVATGVKFSESFLRFVIIAMVDREFEAKGLSFRVCMICTVTD